MEILQRPPANRLLNDLADTIRMEMDFHSLLMAFHERKARMLTQMTFQSRDIDTRIEYGKTHAIRTHEIFPRILQSRLPGLEPQRKADSRRNEIAIEPLEAAR